MISKLKIEGFRGFNHLELSGLQPVNLIVGKNNAGKTSVLESLAILSNPQVMLQQIPSLFRPVAGDNQRRFYKWLISNDFPDSATLECEWDEKTLNVLLARKQAPDIVKAGFHVQAFHTPALSAYASKPAQAHTCKCVPIRYVEPADLVRAFSVAVKQRDGEEIIERVLRKVDPRVRKIRTEVADDGNHVVIDLGLNEMLPLGQAGQGLYRLVSMMSGLIGDRPELALVDEVDDGIHHSVLADVWAGIAEAAELLGIQVFVTTHSYECIQAAHDAFSAREKYGLAVVQLFRLQDRVEGRVLQKDQIATALEGGIDLR